MAPAYKAADSAATAPECGFASQPRYRRSSLPVSLRAPCIAACKWSATQRRARASTLAGSAADAVGRQNAAHSRAIVIGGPLDFTDRDGRRLDGPARPRATAV